MTVKKLQRFAELSAFPNTFQNPAGMKGNWNKLYFKNDHPMTLELACGKGEYALELARRFPDRNFIGIDIKGARLWRGAKTALEENLANVAFLRIPIEKITEHFASNEIEEIWITFPDPFPRKGKARKRLTSPRFLNLYRQILQPDGLVHLKTDDRNLFEYTKEILRREGCDLQMAIENLYNGQNPDDLLTIKTTYELKHLQAGKTIKYLSFNMQKIIPPA